MMNGNAIGLDYHADSVQVAIMSADGRLLANRMCRNDWRAIQQEAQRHGPVVRVAIEACCGAADLAEELVQRAGWHVELAHPGYVARMKQTPDKTDFTDAQLLADLTRVGYLPKVWLAPQHIRQLRALVRYRAGLVDEKRRNKQQLRAVMRQERVFNQSGATPWCKRWSVWVKDHAPLSAQGRWIVGQHFRRIAVLDQDIRIVEQRLREFTRDDRIVQRLQEHAGIGPVTAWVMRAEIGRFDRFNNGKQLARFCGLSPRNASSGKRQADAGLIKAGSSLLRATIIQGAHVLKRREAHWLNLAQRMKQAGKPGSVIAAAVANRWMRRLHGQMRAWERLQMN
jgi:transposase